MASRSGIFAIVLMLSWTLAQEEPSQWIVWNVGQGQWVTFQTPSHCFHFDTGGEFAPWRQITDSCRERANLLSFSHWDWDHVAFAKKLLRYLPNSCLLLSPLGNSSPRKQNLMNSLSNCASQKLGFSYWDPHAGQSANDMSRVFFWNGVLIPGDSPIEKEKLWAHQLKHVTNSKILILGHHGSHTSTGLDLLNVLENLKVTVASSRAARYGHPHIEVRRKLEERKIPLLTTEEWGNLHFYN